MEAKELRDILIQQVARWGEYHDHKETMAWNATALQLTLYAAIILFAMDQANDLTLLTCVVLFIIALLTWWISLRFVENQLKAKDIGADFTAACGRLAFCSDGKLKSFIDVEEEMIPLMGSQGYDKNTKKYKEPHPSMPKFIFDESEIQRFLDTEKKQETKVDDNHARVSSWSCFRGILCPKSSSLTIRQKTECYYYSILNIFAIICCASIWFSYFSQPCYPLIVSFVLQIFHRLF